MIKKGVDIIDVGINRLEDDSKKGYRIVGDVDYDDIINKVNSITPVPGGVGPMTITMLLSNTVLGEKNYLKKLKLIVGISSLGNKLLFSTKFIPAFFAHLMNDKYSTKYWSENPWVVS